MIDYVGIDFGTHQTKVCIKHFGSDIRRSESYEFVKFKLFDGSETYFLPSLVQINDDDTLSYGCVDENRCKTIISEYIDLNLPPKPDVSNILYSTPPKPCKKEYPPAPNEPLNQYRIIVKKKRGKLRRIRVETFEMFLYNQQKEAWKNSCESIDREYEAAVNRWEKTCEDNKRIAEKRILSPWEKECEKIKKEYELRKNKWWKDNNQYRFRYFKQAYFNEQEYWDKETFTPFIISVLYITYVRLYLNKHFGQRFSYSMGAPCDLERLFKRTQGQVDRLWNSSSQLILKYETLENFCTQKYNSLIENINDSLTDESIYVIPEACAGLFAIQKSGTIEGGIHLLVDIGGGTTDISIFTLKDKNKTENMMENRVEIHYAESMNIGLNFIIERYQKQHPSNPQMSFYAIQKLLNEHPEYFADEIEDYHLQLLNMIKGAVKLLYDSFNKYRGDLPYQSLTDAIINSVTLYCGGGSVYHGIPIVKKEHFSQLKRINEKILNVPSLKNDDISSSMFTILSTSYGLTQDIQVENLKIIHVSSLFDGISSDRQETNRNVDDNDYHLHQGS